MNVCARGSRLPHPCHQPHKSPSPPPSLSLPLSLSLTHTHTRVRCRWLVEHRMVDVVVATAGGVEEDLIKCLGDTYVGDFHLKGDPSLVAGQWVGG